MTPKDYGRFKERIVTEVKRRFNGTRATFYYTDAQLRSFLYPLATAFINVEGKDVKAEQYTPNRGFRAEDTRERYVFVFDTPPRVETGEVNPNTVRRFASNAGKMADPVAVWLVALPSDGSQDVKVYDLLEELEGMPSETRKSNPEPVKVRLRR